MVSTMRFITWDEDRELAGIVERARGAAERGGLELEVFSCRYPGEVKDALSDGSGPAMLMTHGFFGEDAFTNNGADEKYQAADLDELAPARIRASSLFVLACYQDPAGWATRMKRDSLLVTTPNYLTTSAVRQLVPALAATRPTTAAQVFEMLQLVAYRRPEETITSELGEKTVEAILAVTDSAVSMLATRTWEARKV
jgi:hypothetical protein